MVLLSPHVEFYFYLLLTVCLWSSFYCQFSQIESSQICSRLPIGEGGDAVAATLVSRRPPLCSTNFGPIRSSKNIFSTKKSQQ